MSDDYFSAVTPESVGIPSAAIYKTLRYFEELRLPLHSVIVARRGKIAFECYWAPFSRDRKHRMYSVSKSWVSLAVGLMSDEGKLSLDDAVVSYFPEYAPVKPHEFLTRATIRDMLMMTDCHDTTTYGFGDKNWVKTWFETPPTHPAGTIFSYNTACTNICCAIVEKIAGMPFVDYLYPRLLEPIGVSDGVKCIQAPEGYSFGGSGVLCAPADLARIALLCLNGGRHNGRQLVSEGYIKEATSRQVDNTLTNGNFNMQQGYGYQFWRTRQNGFACIGMGSQFAVCLPDYDMLVVATGDTQGIPAAEHIFMEGIFYGLTPAVSAGVLPEDPEGLGELTGYVSSLALPIVPGIHTSPTAKKVSGKTYRFGDNALNIRSARFDFAPGEAAMTYEKPNGLHKLTFGIGKLIEQKFPETHYSGPRIGTPAGYGYETRAGAAWADETTLIAKASVTDDYLGSFNMNATFKGDELTLLMTKDAEDFLHDYQGFAAGVADGADTGTRV